MSRLNKMARVDILSEDTISGQHHGEAYMVSLIAGVAMLIISFALNTVGSIVQPIGPMVPIPNGHGGFDYLATGGLSYPYQSLISFGRVFLVSGLLLMSIGVLMARQRMMKPKVAHGLSPYLIGSDAWRVHTMIESQGRSNRTDSSHMDTVTAGPSLADASSGHYSDAQTTDSALSDPASSGSSVEPSAESKATTTEGPTSSSAASKYIRTRTGQTDLELHLSQLRFSRDKGLLTRQEYEDKKRELMKEFRLSVVAMDGPMSFKY